MTLPPRSPSRKKQQPPLQSYWLLAQQPLQSLFFLLPLVLLYEVGTIVYIRHATGTPTPHILAYSMLQHFFEAVGVGHGAYYLPGLIVIVVLLCLHVVRRDRWQFETHIYLWMGIESVLLALPLFVLMLIGWGAATPQWHLLQALDSTPATPWQPMLIYSVGAGIYEELLFRLIAIALVHMFLVDLLSLPEHIGAIGAVAVSALLFALYHFGPDNPFNVRKLAFYSLAGIYFAVVYLLRGFGIVAGTHAMYDILVVLLQIAQHQNT
ncbi:MAG: CPBP family intramembrane metalloprotease [Phycisphaeraceae bacterium]|nr:CPBP family intramembrane metalloprotease [Phycisphaeraceae bacterium]